MNYRIETLSEYPFYHLGKLLQGVTPKSHQMINVSIGEPKNLPPKEVLDILNIESKTLSQYPTSKGTEGLRKSYCEWLSSRFELLNDLDPDKNTLPLSGTREGIFSFIQAVVDTSKNNPLVVMPNPFYKIYEGATHLAGALPFFVNTLSEENFKPDFESVPETVWKDCQLLILCSPSNPTGYCMSKEEYSKVLDLAEKFNFVVCSDECYVDIYPSDKPAPNGLIECSDLTKENSKAVIFHSLSKRSNLAGLRSGFVCANEALISKLLLYRTYHGATLSLPAQSASAWAWSNQEHVEINRTDYDKKYKTALNEIDSIHKVIRPDGSFYLWIELPADDLTFTKKLYSDHNVIALPGSYLGVDNDGINPGSNFIRVAIVHDEETVKKAAFAINTVLNHFSNN
jgi:N-succinyldiaminopimelate aminotransferase|tara:strand:- start:470 stop:1666 length:1197 start_codon:yes stop_codon:yes gene_type:complete